MDLTVTRADCHGKPYTDHCLGLARHSFTFSPLFVSGITFTRRLYFIIFTLLGAAPTPTHHYGFSPHHHPEVIRYSRFHRTSPLLTLPLELLPGFPEVATSAGSDPVQRTLGWGRPSLERELSPSRPSCLRTRRSWGRSSCSWPWCTAGWPRPVWSKAAKWATTEAVSSSSRGSG